MYEGNVGTGTAISVPSPWISRSRITEVWVHAGRGKSFRWLLEHKSWAQVELVVFPGVSLGMDGGISEVWV